MSLPGLPALLPAAAALFSEVTSLSADAITGTSATESQWGIFLNGARVIDSDNVVSVEFRQDFTISNYPIEQGAFASYNKVQHPFEIKAGFSTGGNSSDRQTFLASIAAVIADTNLYDFVTPDAIYTNLNFTHQDYRRNSDRVGLLIVDVSCEEVRPASLAMSSTPTTVTSQDGTTTATSTTSATVADRFSAIGTPQNPAASPQVNGGSVQQQDPTPAQQTQFNNAMPLP